MARQGRKPTGERGAQGVSAGEAISKQLDALAGGIKSGADTERGLAARLAYLTGSARGYKAMEQAGIDVKPKTLIAWLSGDRDPSKANQAKIDSAYRSLRSRNVARSLQRRLEKSGRGTRVEIHPVDQSRVDPKYRRNLGGGGERKVTIYEWGPIVKAWARGDIAAINAQWQGIAEGGLGSDFAAFLVVEHVGFGA